VAESVIPQQVPPSRYNSIQRYLHSPNTSLCSLIKNKGYHIQTHASETNLLRIASALVNNNLSPSCLRELGVLTCEEVPGFACGVVESLIVLLPCCLSVSWDGVCTASFLEEQQTRISQTGAGIAQSVRQLITGWTTEGSEFESRISFSPRRPDLFWAPFSLLSNGAIISGVKRQRREADHSPPSRAEFKNTWIYTSTPSYTFMV
jgi:hypothetical protein